MAYMNQERKKKLASKIKEVLKKYGVSGTLSVQHHSGLVLTLTKGPLDFATNFNQVLKEDHDRRRDNLLTEQYLQVNEYYIDRHFSGKCERFLQECAEAMNIGNFDRSDHMTDYFCVGWYIYINVGRWNKPYVLI